MLKAYRPILLGSSCTVPQDFLGVALLRWPFGTPQTTSLPPFQFGHSRSLNYVEHGAGLSKWANINPTSGVYNWAAMDAYVQAHDAAGRTISFTMHGNPGWCKATGPYDNVNSSTFVDYGAGSCGPIASAYLGEVAVFIEALIRRYNYAAGGVFGTNKTRISTIQAQNEPTYTNNLYVKIEEGYTGTPSGVLTDVTTGSQGTYSSFNSTGRRIGLTGITGRFTKGGQITGSGFSGTIATTFDALTSPSAGTMADTAAYIRQCRLGITAAGDASVKLIGPAFGYPQVTDGTVSSALNTSDGAGGLAKDHLDYHGYNPYNFYSSFYKGPASSLSIDRLIDTLHAVKNMPICYTEFGISAPIVGDEDALYTARAMLIALARGARMINVYSWDAGFFPVTSLSTGYVGVLAGLAGKTITRLLEDANTGELIASLSDGTSVRL